MHASHACDDRMKTGTRNAEEERKKRRLLRRPADSVYLPEKNNETKVGSSVGFPCTWNRQIIKASVADPYNTERSEQSCENIMSPQALVNIQTPHEHDVLSGRGGGTNHHAGNIRFRQLVAERRVDYFNSERQDKPKVAAEIVSIIRQQNPPGRFLKQDAKTKLWHDLGEKLAQKKTSQALREGGAEMLLKKSAAVESHQEQKESDSKQSHSTMPSHVKQKEKTTDHKALREDARLPLTKQAILSRIEIRPSPQTNNATSPTCSNEPLRGEGRKQAELPPPPKPMKRATSNENESIETKRDLINGVSVKRAALNRDNSQRSNSLKGALRQACTNTDDVHRDLEGKVAPHLILPPRYPTPKPLFSSRDEREGRTESDGIEREEDDTESTHGEERFNCDREMRRLSNSMEQTTLSGFIAPARQLSEEGRLRDIDVLYAELYYADTDEPSFTTGL